MNQKKARTIVVLFGIALFWAALAQANVTPASLFQDHMVLQRQMKVPILGTAAAGEQVTVTFAGQTKTATADAAGKWSVKLDSLEANSTPASLVISGSNTVTIKDVLVGEVWLASGQSNMTYWFMPKNYPDELKRDRPLIREFNAALVGAVKPMDSVEGQWSVCTSATFTQNKFSAVAYFFAKELQEKLNVPVGIIHSSYGGTQGESWVSREALDANPVLKDFAENQIAALASRPSDDKAFPEKLAAWIAANGAADPGNRGADQGWPKPGADSAGWKPVTIPANFGQLAMKAGGIVWFRKDLDIPADVAGREIVLQFGWTDDAVQAYWNGAVLPDSKSFYHRNLVFHVPADLAKPGATTVAFRVHSLSTDGHLWRSTADLGLPVAAQDKNSNQWLYRIEESFPDLTPGAKASLPTSPQAEIQNTASCLFNSKIYPLIPYAIRGVIWYQGESNGGRPQTYRTLLTTLIQDWRDRWAEGAFPFYIVQLANNGPPAVRPVDEPWSLLREAQLQVSKDVPHCGLAVAIDIGDAKTIHPPDKLDVGHRLALNALAKTYGQDVKYAGPMYESMSVEGHSIRLKFSHTTGGLSAKGGALKQFTIAGDDGRFVPADAVIDGDSVVVSSPSVAKPSAVRYAWATNPAGCNLYNGAGLPASPFRTDAPENTSR
jgi:sialate O-acetylesterase